jgi:hypothetical protein
MDGLISSLSWNSGLKRRKTMMFPFISAANMTDELNHIAFRLRTKDRPRLLLAMMNVLAGNGARISFEGSLSHSELFTIEGASFEETPLLRRGTTAPPLDFVVLPLTVENVPTIQKAIGSKIAFNGSKGIVHVQIEKDSAMAFAAYDNFHEDCVVAYRAVPAALLERLVESRVLYSYTPA